MKRNKKIILSLILVLFPILVFSSFCFAEEKDLELQYPGEGLTSSTTLPEYIKYIFKFSFVVAAIAAFASLIYGGFRYLTSAGDPGAIKDARSWIFSAIIGLIVLLFSYLILTTINPDLLTMELEEEKPVTGIHLIKGYEKLYYTQDVPEITEGFQNVSLEFLSPKKELWSIFIYPKEKFQGTPEEIKNKKEDESPYIVSVSNARSIRFKWNLPGVYLIGNNIGEYVYCTGNIPDLFKLYFKGSISEIELKNKEDEIGKEITDYRAIFHQFENFEEGCQIFSENSTDISIYPSSLTVFKRKEYASPDVPTSDTPRIVLYPAPNYRQILNDDGSVAVSKQVFIGETSSAKKIRDELLNEVRSIRVPSGFLVVLFEKKPEGTKNPYSFYRCQVFTKDNPDLDKELIGRCGAVTISGVEVWAGEPCATYISIFAKE